MPSIEERVDSLENVLRQFIIHTDIAFRNLEKEFRDFKDEMKSFKDEMSNFKDEMRSFKDEMREEHRKMNKRWGEISNKLGTIIEDIIYPALRPLIRQYFNCEPLYMGMNIKKRKGDIKDEFDAIVECENMVFLVEVKATPKIEYIDMFVQKKINKFKNLFTEYKSKALIPIFASLRFEEDIIDYLTKLSIYAMAYREWEYMDLLNFDKLTKIKTK